MCGDRGRARLAHDVFICHSSSDKAAADAACAVLESHGLRCWIAPRDILPGIDYPEAILEAIAEVKIFLLVFSARANASNQVKREVERAVHRGIPIIPFRIEDVLPTKALEYFISSPHWLDAFSPPLQRHLEHLVEVIQSLLRGETAPPPSPVASAPVRAGVFSGRHAARWLAIGSALVLLSAAGVWAGLQLWPSSRTTAAPTPTQALLSNVVRASRTEPLVFASAQLQADALAPLSPTDMDVLLRQGIPRELVFYLVFEKVELTDTTSGQTSTFNNSPTDSTYPEFEFFVQYLMQHGLRTGPAPGPAAAAGTVQATNGAAPRAPASPAIQLCFDRGLATADANREFDGLVAAGKAPNICGAAEAPNHPAPIVILGKAYVVQITTRSIDGVFNYLGAILSIGDPSKAPVLVDYAIPSETTPAGPLLTVTSGATPPGGCFAEVSDAGVTYCVPATGAANTRSALNALATLLAERQAHG